MFYIIILAIILSLIFLNKNIGYQISVIILWVVYAFRYNVGWDWYNYRGLYNQNIKTYDILYDFLSLGISKLNFGFEHFIVIYSTIIFSLVILSFSKDDKKGYSIILFYSLFYGIFFTYIRQSLGVALFIYSLNFIIKNKKKYFFINFLGILAHKSLVITYPLYIFLKLKLKEYHYIVIIIALNLLYLLKVSVVDSLINLLLKINYRYFYKIGFYLGSKREVFVFNLGYFEKIFIIIFILIYFKKVVTNSRIRFLFNLYFLNYSFNLIFWDNAVLIERVNLILRFSIILFYPILIEKIVKNKIVDLKICKIVFSILSYLFLIKSMFILSNFEDKLLNTYNSVFYIDKELNKEKYKYINRGYPGMKKYRLN